MVTNWNTRVSTASCARRGFACFLAALVLVSLFPGTGASAAQSTRPVSPEVKSYIAIDVPVLALTRLRVIDGTGAPARENQTIIVADGKIAAIGDAAAVAVPAGAQVRDCDGYTVIPGIVGMHDHIIYPAGGGHYNTLMFSAPRLYLAGGVTTIRTTGGMETFSELNLKNAVAENKVPGPRMHVTGPFFEGRGAFTLQMRELPGAEEARAMVRFWADHGVDDIKVYMNTTRDLLKAVVDEAHKRGLKVAGHLGVLGFTEAAELGIDCLEHGLFADTEFVSGKKPDVGASSAESRNAILRLDSAGPEMQALIRTLVARRTAVTSTLPVFETFVPGRPVVQKRVLDVMATEPRTSFLTSVARVNQAPDPTALAMFRKEMNFERAFVKAGGLLLAGPDPTGFGGVVPGFSDQRGIELLVEAGFTPAEAIMIATRNGALYLGELDRIGTLAAGKLADMVLIKGNPAQTIADVRNVEIVFKDGVGYDSAKIIEACRGCVGLR
jgi:imidazolonepropionase-like amidohydrolase